MRCWPIISNEKLRFCWNTIKIRLYLNFRCAPFFLLFSFYSLSFCPFVSHLARRGNFNWMNLIGWMLFGLYFNSITLLVRVNSLIRKSLFRHRIGCLQLNLKTHHDSMFLFVICYESVNWTRWQTTAKKRVACNRSVKTDNQTRFWLCFVCV